MIVYAIADLHGNLPDPPADAELLLIAGDICPDFAPRDHYGFVDKAGIGQSRWLENQFKPWLYGHGLNTIGIWGNHDFVGEKSALVPRMPWLLLQDAYVEWPLGIWGTPWVPGLPYWAFYGREEALQARADLIPEGLDVLMTHGPPRGFGDLVPWTEKYETKYGTQKPGEHVGDPSLNEAIKRSRPKVVVCGHIHEAVGAYDVDGVPVYNVSAVDENYVLRANPWRRLHELS